jgi:hypothetical protein
VSPGWARRLGPTPQPGGSTLAGALSLVGLAVIDLPDEAGLRQGGGGRECTSRAAPGGDTVVPGTACCDPTGSLVINHFTFIVMQPPAPRKDPLAAKAFGTVATSTPGGHPADRAPAYGFRPTAP